MSTSFKKNLRLKNITYMTPLTSPKNIISDSQRMMLSKPSHMHTHSNISNYIHKGTQIINELYRSTSSSPNTSHNAFALTKHAKINLTKKPKPLSTQNSNGNLRNTKEYKYHYSFNNVSSAVSIPPISSETAAKSNFFIINSIPFSEGTYSLERITFWQGNLSLYNF